jgi:hypothetical protein
MVELEKSKEVERWVVDHVVTLDVLYCLSARRE